MPPGLGPLSSAALGRHYELATLAFLKGPPFFLYALIHSGRKADKGVDLRGFWDHSYSAACARAAARGEPLPRRAPAPAPAPAAGGAVEPERRRRWGVVVQCKRWAERVGPDVVRELEGTLVAARGPARTPSQLALARPPRPVLGILASASGFTPGAMSQAAQSELPIMLLHLPRLGPPIRQPIEAGEVDEAGGGGVADERYEARRIEMNRVMKAILQDGAYEVVERIGLGKDRGVKLEWNWLEPA